MESKCPYCDGKGYHEMPDGRPDNLCLLCGGRGYVEKIAVVDYEDMED